MNPIVWLQLFYFDKNFIIQFRRQEIPEMGYIKL